MAMMLILILLLTLLLLVLVAAAPSPGLLVFLVPLRCLEVQAHGTSALAYCYYISKYAIAISAIGPASQAVTKNSKVEQNTVKPYMYDNICLDMRSSS